MVEFYVYYSINYQRKKMHILQMCVCIRQMYNFL